ncbi:MAG: methionyl-tRNA formyltransferase [Kofleriaceae bacterium]|nr:methionyl-tRNA formyltransferase [Kofleriaceae bacterium]
MDRVRVVFMGSPEFAVPSLQAVAAEYDVVAVVCQPDKPAGRGKQLTAPAVKVAALALQVPVLQPASVRGPAFVAQLQEFAADVAVVVAYGKILPRGVLEAFRLGCINVHGSLLPAYRGAAPIQWAVIDGLRETGVTIMQLDEGMDTGPMLARQTMPILPGQSAGALATAMAPIGAVALMQTLREVVAGRAVATAQPGNASVARMLRKEDGWIDFTQAAAQVAARINGVDPWPGAQAMLHAGDDTAVAIKLFGAVTIDGASSSAAPGTIVAISTAGADVACADGIVRIGDIQVAGRKRMAFAALAAGRGVTVGQLLTRVQAPS